LAVNQLLPALPSKPKKVSFSQLQMPTNSLEDSSSSEIDSSSYELKSKHMTRLREGKRITKAKSAALKLLIRIATDEDRLN
jgi:hypothetical protein